MKKAILYIADVYANFLLFRYFRNESESDRRDLDNRFLIAQVIRIIVRKKGYFGVVQAATHRIATRWAGYDNELAS